MTNDPLVITPDQLAKHKSSIGMVYRKIWQEGKDLYAA